MPRETHGNFDQVVEVNLRFFRDQAMSRLSDEPQDIHSAAGDALQYGGRVKSTVRNIWFGDGAEVFDEPTGTWNAAPQVAPFNAIVFAIEVAGQVNIEKVPVPGGGGVTIAPEAGAERLDVHAAAVFLAPLSVQRHAVRATRDQDFPTDRTLCAVALMPTGAFLTNIKVDIGAIRRSPFTMWAAKLVSDLKLGDPEVLVIQAVADALRDAVRAQLLATLAAMCDWHLDGTARVGVVVPTPDMGVTGMEIVTTFESIRVLMQTTGTGGQTALATRSQLEAATDEMPADDLVITINGRALVEQMRAPLAAAFGLQTGDFLAGEPCTVDKQVTVTLGGGSYQLLYLQAGVDESSRLIVWLYLRSSAWWGTVETEIELPLTFTAARVVRGGKQVLALTPHKQPASHATAAFTLPVFHWIAAAVADGMVGGALRRPLDLMPKFVDMPQGTFVDVNAVSLHQNGAPRGDRTWPSTFRLIGGGVNEGTVSELPGLHPGRFRDHDLVIHLAASPYPAPLAVSCIEPDSPDPAGRIDAVGGVFTGADGTTQRRWAMPIDGAIDWLGVPGHTMTSSGTPVVVGRKPTDCPPTNPTAGALPYLRTVGDDTSADDLATRPSCSATNLTTRLSPGFAHWRDVLPFGDSGTDIVNEGVDLDPDCVVTGVTLELLNRAGDVVATDTVGGPGVSFGGGGATIETNPIGTSSLEVAVHWWFDAYHACSYRLRYTLMGVTCG